MITKTLSLLRLTAGLLMALAMLAPMGCYRHVVGVEGAGSGDTVIYEPNLKEPGDSQSTSSKTVPTKTVPSKKAP